MKGLFNQFVLFAWFACALACGDNLLNAQDSKTGRLNIFCTAPAVYGTGRKDSEIAEKINSKIQYFASCYVRNVSSGEKQDFRIRIQFVVKPAGNVEGVKIVYEGTKNMEFLECMKYMFRQLLFARIPLVNGAFVVNGLTDLNISSSTADDTLIVFSLSFIQFNP
ncbi:hypothetical protein L6Q79_10585 [bacterium]|nr:hypothetical protein [bacterium]NUN45979.1 hypothetical protein [bacterium]